MVHLGIGKKGEEEGKRKIGREEEKGEKEMNIGTKSKNVIGGVGEGRMKKLLVNMREGG